MGRDVTVTLDDDSQVVYKNAPDSVTPQDIEKRIGMEYPGKKAKLIDGGKQESSVMSGVRKASDYLRNSSLMNPIGAAAEPMSRISDFVGSGVTEGASQIGLPPEVAGGLGTAANLGVGTLVAGGSGKVATEAAPLMRNLADTVMKSAVKPSALAREGRIGETNWDRARQTMYDKVLPASEGAVEGAQSKVDKLNPVINGILDEAAKRGVTIDGEAVVKSLDALRQDTALKAGKPENLKQIQDLSDRFSKGIDEIKDLHKIPVDLANKIKQAYYKELTERTSAYEPGASLNYFDKAQQKVAAEIRERIGGEVPKVAPPLKEQSDLLNFIETVGPQVGRSGNKNLLGMAWMSDSMARTAGWMLDRYPWFKSYMAQALHHGAERIPQAAVGTGVAAGEALQQRK